MLMNERSILQAVKLMGTAHLHLCLAKATWQIAASVFTSFAYIYIYLELSHYTAEHYWASFHADSHLTVQFNAFFCHILHVFWSTAAKLLAQRM